MDYVLAALIVLGVNLMPAFGPPTWAVLVLMKLNWQLNSVVLVALGALAAGSGRYLLARVSYLLRARLGERRRTNLEAAQKRLEGHRAGAALGLGLFALSPVPSAQLFEAAGVLGLALLPLTVAFFLGRLVSYSIYVSAASLADHSYGDVFRKALTSPFGITLEVLMIIGIVVLTEVDWGKLKRKHHS